MLVKREDAVKLDNDAVRPHKLNKVKFDCQPLVSLDKLLFYKSHRLEAELISLDIFEDWMDGGDDWTSKTDRASLTAAFYRFNFLLLKVPSFKGASVLGKNTIAFVFRPCIF